VRWRCPGLRVERPLWRRRLLLGKPLILMCLRSFFSSGRAATIQRGQGRACSRGGATGAS
jgi:hypothetical protein